MNSNFNHIFFKNCYTPLNESSYDTSNSQYLTTSTINSINYDKVTQYYCKNHKFECTMNSVDAIIKNSNGQLVFIEFKNGDIDKKNIFEIKQKILFSILSFCDITKSDISNFRENNIFILVYNSQKDMIFLDKENESQSYHRIGLSFMRYANLDYKRFGFNIYRGSCFKEIYTFNEKEFDNYLKEHCN